MAWASRIARRMPRSTRASTARSGTGVALNGGSAPSAVCGKMPASLSRNIAKQAARIGRAKHGAEILARHIAPGRLVIGNLGREREIACDVGGGLAHRHAEAAHQIGAVDLAQPEQSLFDECEPFPPRSSADRLRRPLTWRGLDLLVSVTIQYIRRYSFWERVTDSGWCGRGDGNAVDGTGNRRDGAGAQL